MTHLEQLYPLIRHQTRDHIRLRLFEAETEAFVGVVFLIGLVLREISSGPTCKKCAQTYLVVEDQGEVRIFRRWVKDKGYEGVYCRLLWDEVE